jgi:hypothetical protein
MPAAAAREGVYATSARSRCSPSQRTGPPLRREGKGPFPESALPRRERFPLDEAGGHIALNGLGVPHGGAGLQLDGEPLSAHALRVGFITEAYAAGVRDEDIMRHTRHRDLRTMRGYVQRAGLVAESPAGLLDL